MNWAMWASYSSSMDDLGTFQPSCLRIIDLEFRMQIRIIESADRLRTRLEWWDPPDCRHNSSNPAQAAYSRGLDHLSRISGKA